MSSKLRELRFPPSWTSEEILGTVPFQSSSVSEDERSKLVSLFETDASTEYDARHLFTRITPYLPDWPSEVLSYMTRWELDERNHYLGLRRLWSVASGHPESELDKRFLERVPDFGSIEEFLNDPFCLMVALAYDERVTVQAYATDYQVYDSLGLLPSRWIRLTSRDEAYHYRIALKILQREFRERMEEVPSLLERLLAHDLSRTPYGSTFLLDHDDGELYFTASKLRKCAEIIQRQLSYSGSSYRLELRVWRPKLSKFRANRPTVGQKNKKLRQNNCLLQ